MPKQDNVTEEDYLDDLLNSVLSSGGESGLKDDLFDDELKGISGSDEDFFQSIEKDWMDGETEPIKEEATPEKIAKETFEKYKDPVTEEYRDVPPEAAVEYPDISAEITNSSKQEPEQPKQESFEVPAEPEEASAEPEKTSEKTNTSEDEVSEDDMKGLMDILGVQPEENEVQSQEIADLENTNTKRRKKRKEKEKKEKGKGKKKKGSQEDAALDVALDLMEQSQIAAEENNGEAESEQILPLETTESAETTKPADVQDLEMPPAEETQNIDSLITDLGLGDGLGVSEADAKEEEKAAKEKKKKEKKPKKPKKDKKAKKAKKAKKSKREKKPKKEKPPKEPDEILSIPIPFLLFLLSIGAFIVLAATFGGTYYNYQSSVDRATSYYIDQKYGKAYNELYGLEMKKGDKYFFNQVETVGYVNRNYEAYQKLVELGNYQDGLDSLLNGVKMFDKYKDIGREEYNCYEDMNTVLGWIVEELQNTYGITESEAREINLLGRGQQYSLKVVEIASAVQVREGEQTDDSNS